MFNGIIEEPGKVKAIKDIGGGKELTIICAMASSLEVDNSLAIDGVCQTVVRKERNTVTVQVVEETVRKTTLGNLKTGAEVNLERPLSLSQRIDGHLVQGHVDTTGKILNVKKEGTNWLCTIGFDPEWKDLVVGRGSIAVDGISLTVARETGNEFTVAIIPYTWEHTALKNRKKGDRVNLEFDILGKYVVRFMQNRREGGAGEIFRGGEAGESGMGHRDGGKSENTAETRTGVTERLLKNSGFA